jgi:hypothetical protein
VTSRASLRMVNPYPVSVSAQVVPPGEHAGPVPAGRDQQLSVPDDPGGGSRGSNSSLDGRCAVSVGEITGQVATRDDAGMRIHPAR